jgi:hypothetical protein
MDYVLVKFEAIPRTFEKSCFSDPYPAYTKISQHVRLNMIHMAIQVLNNTKTSNEGSDTNVRKNITIVRKRVVRVTLRTLTEPDLCVDGLRTLDHVPKIATNSCDGVILRGLSITLCSTVQKLGLLFNGRERTIEEREFPRTLFFLYTSDVYSCISYCIFFYEYPAGNK